MEDDRSAPAAESTTDSQRCEYPGEGTVYCPECGEALEHVVKIEDVVDRARCPHCESEIARVE